MVNAKSIQHLTYPGGGGVGGGAGGDGCQNVWLQKSYINPSYIFTFMQSYYS